MCITQAAPLPQYSLSAPSPVCPLVTGFVKNDCMHPPAVGNQQTSSTSSAYTTFEADLLESCQSPEHGAAKPTQALLRLRVPHVRQLYNWDCGLACVLMVLKALGLQEQHDLTSLARACGTKSIWTIDLAHLLARCGAAVSLLTVTIGANPSYAAEQFYAESITQDEARVAKLFQEAAAAGILVQERSMPLTELQQLLQAGQHLVIALVDKRKLSPPAVLQSGPLLLPLGPVPPPSPPRSTYIGHFVLLCGYESSLGCFRVLDPALGQPEVHVPASKLEHARKSFGTDEDLLVIAVPACWQL